MLESGSFDYKIWRRTAGQLTRNECDKDWRFGVGEEGSSISVGATAFASKLKAGAWFSSRGSLFEVRNGDCRVEYVGR